MATELILIRHGNAVRVNGDYFHAPLTKLGQEQAEQTGEFLSTPQNHVDGFYSSPLRRTAETAKIIGEKIGKKAETRIGIQEIRFFEIPALIFLELLSITDLVEDYLDARVGLPIRWPVEKRTCPQTMCHTLKLVLADNETSKLLPSRSVWTVSGAGGL